MYRVTLINDKVNNITIHGEKTKLRKGSIVKGINSIDSFSFSISPNNLGFNEITDFKSIIKVYNYNRKKYEFQGRVLYSKSNMDSSGMIYKDVVCESYLGYLNDSTQFYVTERNWGVRELLQHIINVHNNQVEEEKKFEIGTVTVTDANDNVYIGIQKTSSYKCINEKLIATLGGEISLRIEGNHKYIDYLIETGEQKNTTIERCKNMKSISKESNPSSFITKLYPYGAKIKNSSGEETEERVNISSVNNGNLFIQDEEAINVYGIHCDYIEFDDVTDPKNLLSKAKAYLKEKNKIQQKYSVTALDLSIINLDYDDFEVCNYYPVKNKLLNINDNLRILKKTIDICSPTSSTLEFGDKLYSLSDVQLSNNKKIIDATNNIKKIGGSYITEQNVQEIVNTEMNVFTNFIKCHTSKEVNVTKEKNKVEFDCIDLFNGNIFKLESGNIKVISNIKYVKIYGIINLADGFVNGDNLELELSSLDNIVKIQHNVKNNNETIVISPIIIPIEKNGEISIYIKNNTASRGIINNDSFFTYLIAEFFN